MTITNPSHIAETFNVTLRANDTIIQTETNIQIPSESSTKLNFTWNTSGCSLGNYNLSVSAGNLSVSIPILVTISGDLNGDFKVGIFDITTVALAFNSEPSSPNWNPVADINSDGIVDIFDLVVVALHFGETS